MATYVAFMVEYTCIRGVTIIEDNDKFLHKKHITNKDRAEEAEWLSNIDDERSNNERMPHKPEIIGGSSLLDLFKRQNYPVIKRNDLIQNTRYRLSLNEQKFILHMIQLITNKTKELKPITISFKDYAKFLGIKPYRFTIHRLKHDLTKLNSKQFWMDQKINGHHKEILLMWFTSVIIDDDDENVTVQFNPRLKPYLIHTKQFFTEYNYFYIMAMHSSYSIQLYEYFVSFMSSQNNRRGLNYSLDQIRHHLDIQNRPSYQRYNNIKHRILMPAVKEINQLTDLNIRLKPYKKGRKIMGINVLLRKKNKHELFNARNLVEKRLLHHSNKT